MGGYSAGSGTANGGAGGLGRGIRQTSGWASRRASGGAGNPGGKGGENGLGNKEEWKGENGTGGLLIVYCNNFNNEGTIESNGSKGGGIATYPDGGTNSGGGSSGGGSINVFYKQLVNRGTVQAIGGGVDISNLPGGKGGDGTVSMGKVTVEGYTEIPVE